MCLEPDKQLDPMCSKKKHHSCVVALLPKSQSLRSICLPSSYFFSISNILSGLCILSKAICDTYVSRKMEKYLFLS